MGHSWGGGDHLQAHTASLADGHWHQVTATYDGTFRQLYVDGRRVGDDRRGLVGVALPRKQNSIRIGGFSSADYFRGEIAEVRFWNRAFEEDEVNSGGQDIQRRRIHYLACVFYWTANVFIVQVLMVSTLLRFYFNRTIM